MIDRRGGPDERWESLLQDAARRFPYPPTPDVAGAVRHQSIQAASPPASRIWLRWAAAATAVSLLIVGTLAAVPQVRASVLELLRIGNVRILLVEPTPTPQAQPPPSASSPPSPAPVTSVLQLAGETTLAEAEAQLGFPVRLPAHPPELGPPDRVYAQHLEGPLVVLVWLDASQPDRVQLSLHQLGPGVIGEKVVPTVVQETTVNGLPAVWTEGPHLLQFQTADGVPVFDSRRLVTGHVLVWQAGEITYRLETDMSLEEAVEIAESLE
jgi:hypothetical protein